MEYVYTSELPGAEDLYGLYERLGWNHYLQLNKEQLQKAIGNSYYSVFVYDGTELIATGRVVSDGFIHALICGLGVCGQYRHRGIATKIIHMLTKRCKQNDLFIQLFCEEHLTQFYRQLGFEKFGVGMLYKQ